MDSIIIYDTTLRDGMQGTGINFTLEDKISIAHKLDDMHIDYIEGGFPLASEREAEFFNQIKKEKLHHAKIVAFGSTRKPNTKVDKDINIRALLDAETASVIVVGKAWTDHVKYVLNTTEEENLAMIYDSIQYLKKEGREVFFDLEHFFNGFLHDPQYALKVLMTGTEAGADTLVLCDTIGGMLPSQVTQIFKQLPLEKLKPIGVHCRNDAGTAVANSLAAIEAGACQVQGTINGWGERCGNANLCVLIPNIVLKMKLPAAAGKSIKHLTSLARFVAEKANIIPDKRQPYVGDAAFSHKSGQHADVIHKAAHLMEHIDSGLVGNERKILLSELAGKSTIVAKLSKYGDYDKSSDIVKKLIDELKRLEQDGYEYEAAEGSFDLIIRKTLGIYKPLFTLNNYHLESYKFGESTSRTVGRILVTVKNKDTMGAAVMNGPVDTLDHALRDALILTFPFIKKIKLIDYRVRVLNPESATGALVRVFITSTDMIKSWDTVGISENIIEASWQALVDSFEYYYNNYYIEEQGSGKG